jgi:hypothetical protein
MEGEDLSAWIGIILSGLALCLSRTGRSIAVILVAAASCVGQIVKEYIQSSIVTAKQNKPYARCCALALRSSPAHRNCHHAAISAVCTPMPTCPSSLHRGPLRVMSPRPLSAHPRLVP